MIYPVTISPIGPARLGILVAKCAQPVDGDIYSAYRNKAGKVTVTAINAHGEARLPMLTRTNKTVWDTLTAALRAY